MNSTTHKATLPKSEKLCSETETSFLFANGTSFVKFPLRVIYAPRQANNTDVCQILTSVPKKRYKRAVHRNRIKRLMREAYRLNKDLIGNCSRLNIAFVCIDNNMPTYEHVERAMTAALKKIAAAQAPSAENTQPTA